MSSLVHANKRLWQRHVIAENRRSIEGLLATLTAEPLYVIMATGAEHRGRDAVAAFYTGLFVSMPDVTFALQAAYIGENGVVEESVLVGTHTGDLFGLAPTGRPVHLPLTIVFPMVNGDILGERMYFDMDSLQRQLGLRA
ncbi:MAG: ester cyclase [Anaerolineales bacterium]|nr:ester cyclase [Anaerolineales bacterium]